MGSVWLNIIKTLLFITLAALGVSVVFLVIDLAHPPPSAADQIRADTAKQLMAALEKYRSAKGAYPLLINNPIKDLKPTLVDGGFLKAIPPDLPDAQPMRYISNTGTSYGILSTKNRKPCLIEVGVSNTKWWALSSEDFCSYD